MQDSDFIKFLNITKVFPGQTALNNVSFNVMKGEIHALLGENGAGKSTLLNILHGVFPQTAGEIYIGGQKISFNSTYDAIKFGIEKVHQEINLIPEMTVIENLLLGSEYTSAGLINRKRMYIESEKTLKKLKCRFKPDTKTKYLNVGEKQMIQIAKAIRHNAMIISFDEPTASLTSVEVETLFSIIKELKARGITILYISHKLEEIYNICDRATVLRDGQYIGTYSISDTTKEELIRKMIGRNVDLFAKRKKPNCADISSVVLKVENLSGEFFSDISFDLHQSELLGFFGLVGAKRTETMRAIFGADKLYTGQIFLRGKSITIKNPADAVNKGIGLIPENRKEEGFIKDLNNCENIALAALRKFDNLCFQNKKKKIHNAQEVGKKVGLNPNDPYFMTSALSGGNQQKVILAKWISTDANILVFDEPTKGIDVGSKDDIYTLMEELLIAGKSIIMISSELPEIIGMCDRVIVMREGRIAAVLNHNEVSESLILTYAIGN